LTRVALLCGVLLIAVLLPLFLAPTDNDRVTRLMVLAIAIVSLNLLAGFSGQISVGHGAFAGLGAYTTAILAADHGWPHLLTLVAAAVLCLVAGLVFGLPALRIRGVYLALVTLSLAVVFPTVIEKFSSITGGSAGKSVPPFESPFAGLEQDQWSYYLALVFTVVIFALVYNMVRSRVGRALIGVRDNEIAAQVVGMNVGRYKVMTFGVSAMFAGIAGSLMYLTVAFPFVDARSFTLTFSIYLLVASVVGGTVSLAGAFIGALFIEEVPDLITNDLGFEPELTPVLFGAVLILLMFVAPGGAVGLFERGRLAFLRRIGRTPSTISAADAAFSSSEHIAEEVAAAEPNNQLAAVTDGQDKADNVPQDRGVQG
jgi:branched-chain amino acid transport system permease protein